MAIWMVRAGKHGEYEQSFLENGKLYLTWEELSEDLNKIPDRKALFELLTTKFPNAPRTRNIVHGGEIWSFVHNIIIGDWIVLPSKLKPAIHVGEVTRAYHFDPSKEPTLQHSLGVKWIARDIPRTAFDKDLLHSMGSTLTICQIRRNDAEKRIRAMATSGWKSMPAPGLDWVPADVDDTREEFDLERAARDQISKLIVQRFQGHGLERLVEAVLKAQGYFTYRSSEGADKGIDLLAAPGALGFGTPRICVQVKSQESPVDRPTLDQLIGAMQNFHADQGLLVSWGGFKQSVDRERATQFFRVRLWDQDSLIDQIFEHYDKLDEDTRAELPLKRIWVAVPDDDLYP